MSPSRLLSHLCLLLCSCCPVGASYCSSLTDCFSCIDAVASTGYSCHWCNKDHKCHALGSPESACFTSKDCVSLSSISTCANGSVAACPAADLMPEQLHLAFAGEDAAGWPSGMSVSWFTVRPTTSSHVAYGTAPDALTSSAAAVSTQYWKDYGFHHRSTLLGLRPATKYFYQAVSGTTKGAVGSFVTAVSAASPAALHVFGDLGYENSTERPMSITGIDGLVKNWSASYTRRVMGNLAASGAVDAVWHLGDIGYVDDSCWHELDRFTYEETYNRFMRWVEPVASAVPYMVAAGNHESECHSPLCVVDHKAYGLPLSNFSAYNARWTMPSASSGGVQNMWYSFNLGPMHVVSANSETDWPGAGEEFYGDWGSKSLPAGSFGRRGEYLAWLEADLAKAHADRAARPWVIVGSHRPFEELNKTHGELFNKYRVDAYFAGHVHSYTRETVRFPDGHEMLSVVVGGAGSDEQAQVPPSAARGAGNATFATARYASGVLHASSTELSWRLIDSEAGTPLDEASLEKAPSLAAFV